MKIQFWAIYLLVMLPLVAVAYFSTADTSGVPFTLSDTQMEQLKGSGVEFYDFTCAWFYACSAVPCNNNTKVERIPGTAGPSCDSDPNNTCYWVEPTEYFTTCTDRTYAIGCSGAHTDQFETYRKCE